MRWDRAWQLKSLDRYRLRVGDTASFTLSILSRIRFTCWRYVIDAKSIVDEGQITPLQNPP